MFTNFIVLEKMAIKIIILLLVFYVHKLFLFLALLNLGMSKNNVETPSSIASLKSFGYSIKSVHRLNQQRLVFCYLLNQFFKIDFNFTLKLS